MNQIDEKEPKVNPFFLATFKILLISGIIGLVAVIVTNCTSSKSDHEAMIQIVVPLALIFFSFNRINNLTRKRDEWRVRKNSVISESIEIKVTDRFSYAYQLSSSDIVHTYFYHFLVSDEKLFMIHPHNVEAFLADNLTPGTVIIAHITIYDSRPMILRHELVSPGLTIEKPNFIYNVTGTITEKFMGAKPEEIDQYGNTKFWRQVSIPDSNLFFSSGVQLKMTESDLRNINFKGKDHYILRINRYLEYVSETDFLKFTLGQKVTFERDEKSGLSAIKLAD